jgi:hypothetical protein
LTKVIETLNSESINFLSSHSLPEGIWSTEMTIEIADGDNFQSRGWC